MSTTTEPTTRSYAREITELLRDKPDHDIPPAERQTWMQLKVELLAAVQAFAAPWLFSGRASRPRTPAR